MRAKINVIGIVQGVGFRPFVYRMATENSLKGYVRNRGDAGVEIVVEGQRGNLKQFLKDLEAKKPSIAQIHAKFVNYTAETGEFDRFEILKSSETRELAGSIVPPDIAICDECVKELRSPENPRQGYFFITCTDCGPRYTTIKLLPYDRKNTTMHDFQLCKFCQREYADPSNRRFHAQTVACPKCGPRASLTTSNGQPIATDDPIRKAGHLLEEGNILAIKGYGGFHVATATTQAAPIQKLRRTKHRAQKPFAIMARNLKTVRTFAQVSPEEAHILTSYAKPIVLLDKSPSYHLSDLIAPSLHNIGVMLPYTGLHLMLFDETREPAFVMTSANPPSEPIVTRNDEALRKLRSTADYFLFHDREIAQRCDDSVVRMHGMETSFVRRSRGYAPTPIPLLEPLTKCVLGVGAEENVTACLLSRNKAFISQYIGDVENLETYAFLKEAVNHLIGLTHANIDVIACDLHPKFATTRLAEELSGDMGCSVVRVQHHHAHVKSLMAEQGLEEIIGVVCDGYGYGADGTPWGGEVLRVDGEGFKRVAHLQGQPLIGGDLASRFPMRMVAGILANVMDVEDWLLANSTHLPYGEEEAQTILNQMGRPSQSTTSCGRMLDAISAMLGICFERTYQGEPAVKLESAAQLGSDVLGMKPQTKDGILNTTSIARAVFEERKKLRPADLAYSAQSYLARGLAQLAIDAARATGIKTVGFSGGVAYNRHITETLRNYVEREGFQLYVQETVPPGDGGISFGQAVAVATAHENETDL